MPPKKGKKGKKDKAAPEPEEEESEHDTMDLDMLREIVPMLRQQMEKAQLDRNYVQLERDTIQTFYDITKNEVRNLEMLIAKKDREMEIMEDNHRVEVRVYLQKVRHLEYEHQNNLTNINIEGADFLAQEEQAHEDRAQKHKKAKKSLKMELAERDWVKAEEIKKMKAMHERNLEVQRKIFEKNTDELEVRCKDKLKQLEADLELRRKVHIHEIEERKNLHINDLMHNHEKAFENMKTYYNDITNDNLKLIRDLKEEVAEMKKKQGEYAKNMYSISLENQRLKEPLTKAVAEVASLRAQLKDRDKDRLSLRNAKARLQVLEGQRAELRQQHKQMQADFVAVESERDQLYGTFETAIKNVQQKTDFSNVVLEQKMKEAASDVGAMEETVEQIANGAKLDPNEIQSIKTSINDALRSRNGMISDLEYQLLRLRKGFNDSLRTLSEKMTGFGIPQDEVTALGFVEFPQEGASLGPAGLVVEK